MTDVPFEAIVSSMAEGVVAVDGACRIRFINPTAQALFGVRAPVQPGQGLLEVIRHAELQQLLQHVLATGQAETRDLTLFGPEERVLRAQAVTFAQSPAQRGALVVLSDLTEIRKLESLRRDFVANVSHELRTPVTAIQASVEALQAGASEQPKERAQFIGTIATHTERLARLIDDLMALSQVESGGIPFRFDTVTLEPIFRDAADVLRTQAAKQSVTVTVQLHDAPPVRADRERLYQVAQNLLDNAIKFNRPGGTVTVSAASDERAVTVAVADTGAGIPPEDILRIFERFYRVEKGRARATGGTGLGLAIVKHLVEAHHGTIRAASTPGQGSTFYVTLPRPA